MISGDIQQTVGTLQLCAGQAAGIEAVIHAMRYIYDDDNTETLLLVDAKNAFIFLNQKAALHNISYTLPCYVDHTPEYLWGNIRSLCRWRDLGLV